MCSDISTERISQRAQAPNEFWHFEEKKKKKKGRVLASSRPKLAI
jgi:hypothetical protein